MRRKNVTVVICLSTLSILLEVIFFLKTFTFPSLIKRSRHDWLSVVGVLFKHDCSGKGRVGGLVLPYF